MKVGFLGTGRIAATLAGTVRRMDGMELYACASRTQEKAEAFRKEQGFAVSYGSYEELVKDPEVGLVYIATPHSRHYEDMLLCIEAGKPVLCEKAFTMNASEAELVLSRAKEKGVFVAEAIWTRYMPSRKIINEVLESGAIGKAQTLTANLSYVIDGKKRIVDPELAGGALLDVGVYGLNFAAMHFGTDIERIDSSVRMTESGVDGCESITIHYKNGRMAVLTHGIWTRGDRMGVIYGDKGYMVVENINDPVSVSVYDTEDRLIHRVEMPEQISGYEYQFEECAACIEAGKIEPHSMPHEDTLLIMRQMDGIRAQWGMVYPKER